MKSSSRRSDRSLKKIIKSVRENQLEKQKRSSLENQKKTSSNVQRDIQSSSGNQCDMENSLENQDFNSNPVDNSVENSPSLPEICTQDNTSQIDINTSNPLDQAKDDISNNSNEVISNKIGNEMDSDANQSDKCNINKKKYPLVRGLPKSGKPWKEALGLSKRSSSRITIPSIHISFEERKKIKERDRLLRMRVAEIKKAHSEAKNAERLRIKDSRRTKQENSIKSSQYQVVTNSKKLKNMSKKQLRNFRKLADINKA